MIELGMATESISRSLLQSNGLSDYEADLVLSLINLQDRESQQQVGVVADLGMWDPLCFLVASIQRRHPYLQQFCLV